MPSTNYSVPLMMSYPSLTAVQHRSQVHPLSVSLTSTVSDQCIMIHFTQQVSCYKPVVGNRIQ